MKRFVATITLASALTIPMIMAGPGPTTPVFTERAGVTTPVTPPYTIAFNPYRTETDVKRCSTFELRETPHGQRIPFYTAEYCPADQNVYR